MPKPSNPQSSSSIPSAESISAESASILKRRFWILHKPQTKGEWAIVSMLTMACLVLLLLAAPATRYTLTGHFVERPATIEVTDSRSGKPVSDVVVTIGHTKYTTTAKGKIKIAKLAVGRWPVTVNKRYYNPLTTSFTQPLLARSKTLKLKLTAIGNEVSIRVVNKITGRALAGASISALGATATTDSDGGADLVLPVGRASVSGSVKLSDYNDQLVTIKNLTAASATSNTFGLTSSGHIFYLDKRTGVINVMKANLDGSNPSVVLAGTGKESDTGTVLLASRDWKYLALLASRDTAGQDKLYLIDTSSGQTSVIDQGNGIGFNLVGWVGDNFAYEINRPKAINGTYDQTVIKSYQASTGHLSVIDQTDAGPAGSGVAQSSFGQVYIIGNNLVYDTFWSSYGYYGYTNAQALVGHNQSFIKAASDGTSKQTLKTIDATKYQSITTSTDNPAEIYYQLNGADANGNASPILYYSYKNGSVAPDSSVTQDDFGADFYPTYIESPSGQKTLWYDQRDGKNTLFTGDANGDSSKQIASLSDFTPYGWFSDSYILLSKNSSELYIAPADLSSPPVKITDYHKPAVVFNGYGGGYGGQ